MPTGKISIALSEVVLSGANNSPSLSSLVQLGDKNSKDAANDVNDVDSH